MVNKNDSEGGIGAESVNIEDDLRALEDVLVTIVALVARMLIGYSRGLNSFRY